MVMAVFYNMSINSHRTFLQNISRRIFRKKEVFQFSKHCLTTLLLLMMVVWSFGGSEFFFGMGGPFGPKHAEATVGYTETTHTIEYNLGGGSDNTTRASGALVYAGNSWNAVKATAGAKSIKIDGTDIRVLNAYLEVGYMVATGISVNNESIVLDVGSGPSAGTDVQVAQELSTNPYLTSGLSGYLHRTHDVTAFFDRQTDVQWNAGVPVEAGVAIAFSAAGTRALTTVKLVVTYESRYDTAVHNETKTVRFPLDSNTGTDTGTKTAVCAAAATCPFIATSTIPDAAADADIYDVYFELHAQMSSNVASTFQPQIAGGTAGPAYAWAEANLDSNTVDVTFVPTIGGTNFNRNVAMTLNIINGTVPLNALGGEMVVTYKYSTGASSQTETLRYFANQGTTSPGTTKNTFPAFPVSIVNSGKSVTNAWYRIRTPAVATTNFTVFSTVGTSTEKNKIYALNVANPRAGDTPWIYHDMTLDARNMFATSTNISGATQYSAAAGAAPSATEFWVTFTWSGSQGGDVTKTVTFGNGQQGTNARATQWNNMPLRVDLPEEVTKTYRSVYLESFYAHSNTTSITTGTITIGVNGSTTVVTEVANGVTEEYHAGILHKVASTTFSGGNTISWITNSFEINETKSMANTVSFGNYLVITYDVAFSQSVPSSQTSTTVRTIEYILGNGTDNTARGNGILAYAGASWNTVKATAGKKTIEIEGSGISIRNAYLVVGYEVATAVSVNHESITFDVDGTPHSGADNQVGQTVSTNPYVTSGLSGFVERTHDVTSFLTPLTDTQWNAGIGVVAGVSISLSAAGNRSLTTTKLVITYEENYSLVPHTEVKTVRFPLDSSAGTDAGSKTAQCAAAATCPFIATSTIPDAVSDGDILDVFYELHAEVNSNLASTLTPQIAGGTAGPAFAWVDVLADDNTVHFTFRPTVGSPNFQRNVAQTLNIIVGTVPVNQLGGELVVTYRYATDAVTQTDTVRYYIDQRTTAPGTTKNYATTTLTISNNGKSIENIWLRVHHAPVAATNFSVFGKVGTSTERSNVYAVTATNPRGGSTPVIIQDLSLSKGNMFATSTTIVVATQYSAVAGSPPAIEAFMTFTWSGKFGGTVTRTILSAGGQQGVNARASEWNNGLAWVELPETATRSYRSAYIDASVTHSQATSITVGTITVGETGSTTVITETADTTSEAYHTNYFYQIASSTFFGTSTNIGWYNRSLIINETKSVANAVSFGNQVITTVDLGLELLVPVFTQNYYRIYVDNDLLKPTDPWPLGATDLGENSELTASDEPPLPGEHLRLRMSMKVSTTTLLGVTQGFNLQFAPQVTSCSAVTSWTNLGAPASGAIWRGWSGTPVDEVLLSGDPPSVGDLLLSVSDRAATYENNNSTAPNPFAVNPGEDVEYDWSIENNGAVASTPYCFRMVESGGSAFSAYDYYPVIRTAGYNAKSQNWQWFDDETVANPLVALAPENTAPVAIASGNLIKLRMTIKDVNNIAGANVRFKIQYSEYSDFSANVSDVNGTSTCTTDALWCYGDGVDTDDTAVTARVLADSTANGRHNESGVLSSTFSPAGNTAYEVEFTLKDSGALPNHTYFFRAYNTIDGVPVRINTGESYPSLSTEGVRLDMTVLGLPIGTTTSGIVTDISTSPTAVAFGSLLIGTDIEGAQRMQITTNATSGYQVLAYEQQDLSTTATSVPHVLGTNAVPTAWATGCTVLMIGCYGYHTSDSNLSGGSARFLADDTYAAWAQVPREVAYFSGPVATDTVDIIYKIRVTSRQPAGDYSTSLVYVATPTF